MIRTVIGFVYSVFVSCRFEERCRFKNCSYALLFVCYYREILFGREFGNQTELIYFKYHLLHLVRSVLVVVVVLEFLWFYNTNFCSALSFKFILVTSHAYSFDRFIFDQPKTLLAVDILFLRCRRLHRGFFGKDFVTR